MQLRSNEFCRLEPKITNYECGADTVEYAIPANQEQCISALSLPRLASLEAPIQ
jgi:hypothetical protein